MKARDNIIIALSSGDQRTKAMAATAMTLGLGNKSNAPGNQSMTSRAGNCFLVTVVIICVCIMVACGVMVVREYALAKGYEFARCRVSILHKSLKLFLYSSLDHHDHASSKILFCYRNPPCCVRHE